MTIEELASADSLPQTERVHVARLKSGDVIVVEVCGCLSYEGKQWMAETIKPIFPDNLCLILEQGTTVKVVSAEDAAFTTMRAALQNLLNLYVSDLGSGPEPDEVIAAREALS